MFVATSGNSARIALERESGNRNHTVVKWKDSPSDADVQEFNAWFVTTHATRSLRSAKTDLKTAMREGDAFLRWGR